MLHFCFIASWRILANAFVMKKKYLQFFSFVNCHWDGRRKEEPRMSTSRLNVPLFCVGGVPE